MKLFLAAVSFLTRVPLPRRFVSTVADVGRSARWFALIGALIGSVYWFAMWALSPLLPAMVVAVLIMVLEALLTGAIHLDGLADMADGFGGGSSREDVLRIMRDHAIGAYGATALALAILLKVTAIAALIDRQRAGPYLVLSPTLGRWSTVMLSYLLPYARCSELEGRRPEGSVVEHVTWREIAIATAISLVIVGCLDPWRGVLIWLIVIAISGIFALVCRRRIGGLTGDTLGANLEICEAAVFLGAVALP